MTRLSRATLGSVPAAIPAPRGRAPLSCGIVHFGPGAFHRAHQAVFIDDLLDQDQRWGIAAVSLRTAGTVAALAEQDGLYTLAIRDREPAMRLIGAHTAFLGPEDAAAVHHLLADPAVVLVTATVTEKGYCLTPDGALDLAHPDIVHDLAGPAAPRSLIGWLVAGLAARRTAGTTPFTPMPCDNLADNGRKLHAALVAFAAQRDEALAGWIAHRVRAPSTMVDSITPASDAHLYSDIAAATGLEDRAAVQREAFSQWVVEDIGLIGPDLAVAGVTLTADVAAYERAKLRILNGAHSTLAYRGLLRGYETVAEAMTDPELAGFLAEMIAEEIAPMLAPVAGFDLAAYSVDVLARFRNPAIAHRLAQIAQDGSQKLPYRLGDTLLAQRSAGRIPVRVLTAFGAWIAFITRQVHTDEGLIDPLAGQLATIVRTGDPHGTVRAFAAQGIGIPVTLADDPATIDGIATAIETFQS